MQAGDRARELYAYDEARQHYARALDALARLPDTEKNRRRRVDALIAQADSSLRIDSPERNLSRMTEAEQLAQGLDRPRLARIHLLMGRAHQMGGAYRECIRYYRQALLAARAAGDDELVALSSGAMGHVASLQGHCGKAKALLSQAIPLLEQTGHESEWFRTQGYYGVVLAFMGDYTEGVDAIQRARAWAHERHALTEIIQSGFFLNAAHCVAGNLPRALEVSREIVEQAERFGDRVYIHVGCYHRSWALVRAGQVDAAAACVAKAEALARELGEQLVHADSFAAIEAEIAYGEGRAQETVALAKRAADIAQAMDSVSGEGRARRIWGQALAALVPPQWDEAEAQLTLCLRRFEAGQNRLEAARTHEAWGAVCRDRGDLTAARTHWERAAAQWERSGLDHELVRTQALIESLTSEES